MPRYWVRYECAFHVCIPLVNRYGERQMAASGLSLVSPYGKQLGKSREIKN